MFVQSLMVLLVAAFGGTNSPDLVSCAAPRDYFRSRKIEVSLEKMAELANKAAGDPRSQLQRLLAIRWLGEEADLVKKSSKYAIYRKMLDEIARGNAAGDSTGFAKEYALQALDAIVGKKSTPRPSTDPSMAFAGFPPNPAGILFLQSYDPAVVDPDSNSVTKYRRLLKAKERENLYADIERIGNVRVDYLSMAIDGDKDRRLTPDRWRCCIRVFGRFDHNVMKRELKGAGLPIRELVISTRESVCYFIKDSVLLALVGNTQVLGFLQEGTEQELQESLKKILTETWPKDEKLAMPKLVQRIPAKTCLAVICDAKIGDDSFRLDGFAQRARGTLNLEAKMVFDTEAQADGAEAIVKQFKGSIRDWLQQAATALALADHLGVNQDKSPVIFDGEAIVKSFEKIETKTTHNKFQMKAALPDDALLLLLHVSRSLFQSLEEIMNRKPAEPEALPKPKT